MLDVAGAVVASGPDAGVAAHYGDPMREQRLLAAGRAVVDLSHLGVVAVTGSDRLGWLDTLSSQRVRDLAPGQSAELLLLDVHGRVEHSAALVDDGVRTLLVTEAAHAEPLATYLDRMRFMLDVAVAPAHVAVLGVVTAGEAAGEAAVAKAAAAVGDGALLATWRDPWPGVVPGGTRYALVTDHPGAIAPTALLLVAGEAFDDVAGRLLADGTPVAGTLAWEALRVAGWRPRLAAEVDEKSLPHELDWLRTAVHLDKGCYRGQEGVARTFNLGRPPRRLVMLHLDGSDHLLPEAGAAVAHGDRVVGRVTSVARHHELGPVALAVLKRSVPADVELRVQGPAGDIAASQEVVVGTDGFGQGRPADRGPVTPGLRRPQG
ncbi:YgfZ/GcvT domain-containing protein [Litorihabitans aurantiacus]|uniref:Folate-binding protein n=1 Tax=Litorihabitans aurantiacus TaxID=1930061 RepID=A0AA37XCW7_9MICO|nr:glycine cleavage T C-terminal barrel domain-containing protein [Litorihabitans aurantiacus]GMA30268.1 folate-binding protein [Litorihabitans aurantiacus]